MTANTACGAGDGTYATCDSRGAGSPASFAQGYIDGSNGLMAGAGVSGSPSSWSTSEFVTDEGDATKNFPVTRVYNPGFSAPSAGGDVQTYMDHGVLVMYSNVPPTATGICPNGSACSAWGTVANGGADSTLWSILNNLNTWTQDTGAEGQVVYLFNHEPWKHSTDKPAPGCSTCYGSSQDYRAAMAHIANLIHNGDGAGHGPYTHVLLGYAEVDSNMTKKVTGGAIGTGDKDYAGITNNGPCSLAGAATVPCSSSNIDILAPDVYNYYVSNSEAWHTFDYRLNDSNQGMVTLAAQDNKKLLFAEFGSHPGCNGATDNGLDGCTGETTPELRDSWFSNGERIIEQSTKDLTWLDGWAYYHVDNTGKTPPGYNWKFLDQSSHPYSYGKTGWINSFANNPLYKSTPISIP